VAIFLYNQARNMVYGIRDQSPKLSLGLGSEAWNRGSQCWNWGSSIKFGDTRIRDQNFSKKWVQGSKLSKNSMIIKTKIYHVTSLIYTICYVCFVVYDKLYIVKAPTSGHR